MFYPRMSLRQKARARRLAPLIVGLNPAGWINLSMWRARRIKADEEERAHKLQEAEQSRKELRKELETNPALCEKMELEDRRKVEARRDYAFHQMEDMELHRIFGMGSIFHQMAAHKVFWAWRKQALSELQQLRETERSSREKLAQDPTSNAALAAKENMIRQFTSTEEGEEEENPPSYSDYEEYLTRILPITLPADFARNHPMEQARIH